MIRCACLLDVNYASNEILLVRVRDNTKWYLPGGKIEANELASAALIRELREELAIELDINSVQHVITITDQALGVDDLVELNCYTANYSGLITPQAEISEVAYINWQQQRELLAPAIITLCEQIFN